MFAEWLSRSFPLHSEGVSPCHVWRDFRHATMIGWAAPEKARTAVRFFLDDRAARRDRSCAERIRGPEYGDDGKSDRMSIVATSDGNNFVVANCHRLGARPVGVSGPYASRDKDGRRLIILGLATKRDG